MKLDCDLIARMKAEGKTKEAKQLISKYQKEVKLKRQIELDKIKQELKECNGAIKRVMHPEYQKNWKAKNPEKLKVYALRDKYGKEKGNIVYLLENMFQEKIK